MSKKMTKSEIKLLQVLPREMEGALLAEKVLAELLRLIASWMGSPSKLGFEAFAKLYLQQGNAKDKKASVILCDVFGVAGDTA